MGIDVLSGMLGIGALTLTVFLFWSLFWKGWALWVSARNDSKFWFILLLILNTMGIAEILYIFVFSKNKKTEKLDKYVDQAVDKVKEVVKEVKD